MDCLAAHEISQISDPLLLVFEAQALEDFSEGKGKGASS